MLINYVNIGPIIPIYSEEGGNHRSDAATRWIVDPLDGTTPWVWGNSGFAVSIAFQQDGVVTNGAVYDPVMDEFFYADLGRGATLNNVNIRVASAVPLSEALLVVDWAIPTTNVLQDSIISAASLFRR